MRSLSVTLVAICLVIGALVGLGSYTFIYAKGFSYLSTDPKACANCHIMQEQYDGWERSPHHHAAVCADCHMPSGFFAKYLTKAENGFLHSKAFTLQNFADPIQIRERSLQVTNEACQKCHSSITGDVHATADREDPKRCTHCHSDVGH